MTPRAVFDCMVLVQAAANPGGPAGGCFERAERGAVGLCASSATRDEFREVIHRPKLRRGFSALTDERLDRFFETLDRVVIRIDPVPELVALARDPKDAKYLNLAVAAGAELVVSRDNDLLDLMTGSDPDAVAFRTNYPMIRVLDPAAFLRMIDTLPPDPLVSV